MPLLVDRQYSPQPATPLASPTGGLLEAVDLIRQEASRSLSREHRSPRGQFFTPAPVARLIASFPAIQDADVSLLDAGAGVGSLFAACVDRLCSEVVPPASIRVTAYENDPLLLPFLTRTAALCREQCRRAGIAFKADVRQEDFLEAAAALLGSGLFPPEGLPSGGAAPGYTLALLNPPYGKIGAASPHRRWLRQIGVETSNLYAGFVAAAARLLSPQGEMVAITPRSFCNGPYFQSFRKDLLARLALRRLHLFDSRGQAFQEDGVLQENLILHAACSPDRSCPVTVSIGFEDGTATVQQVPYAQVVRPDDPQAFLRIPEAEGGQIMGGLRSLPGSLSSLGLSVSTGRVVDFRVKEFLRQEPETGTVPLLYPGHLKEGRVCWPKAGGKKPNALVRAQETEAQLVPSGFYVLVRRFSAKEERRRVVAAVCSPADVPSPLFAFENHLNFYHAGGAGLSPEVACGLAAYLNSSAVDAFFRQFSGHTQVNATDLRALPYPSLTQMENLGRAAGGDVARQEWVDGLVEEMFRDGQNATPPVGMAS